MRAIHVLSFVLVVVGAMNWGLVGLFDFNLVDMVFGAVEWLERLVYVLVGVAGAVLIATHKKDCKVCVEKVSSKPIAQTIPPTV
jgi:hypothetical protein